MLLAKFEQLVLAPTLALCTTHCTNLALECLQPNKLAMAWLVETCYPWETWTSTLFWEWSCITSWLVTWRNKICCEVSLSFRIACWNTIIVQNHEYINLRTLLEERIRGIHLNFWACSFLSYTLFPLLAILSHTYWVISLSLNKNSTIDMMYQEG